MRTRALTIALTLIATPLPLSAETINATDWRVPNGDDIRMLGRKIHLAGIDAPEAPQSCRDAEGEVWACGEAATQRLKALLINEVICEVHGKDRHGRDLAICFSNGIDVGKTLVEEGLAVAEYGDLYTLGEAQARREKKGIWAGSFMRPRAWRRANLGGHHN